MNGFVPDERVLELLSLVVDDLRHVAKGDIAKQIKVLGEEIAGLNRKIDEADDMLMSKEIDKDTHRRIISRHTQCISELLEKQKFLKDSDMKAVQEKMNFTKNILTNLGDYFDEADTETKIKLVGSIIKGKMQFLENTYRTSGVNEVLAKIALIPNELQGMEKEKASVSAGLSNLALPLGLEPRTL